MKANLSNIGAVGGGAGHTRVGGEANLIVDYHVYCTMGGVVGQV